MNPTTLAILLVLAGAAMLIAEMLLPSGGVLGVLAAVCLAASVVTCFRIDSRLGFGLLVAIVVAVPLGGILWMKLFPRTIAGRQMILGPVTSELRANDVDIGQTGVAISELRPTGICDFGAERLEARAERGTIPAGARVRVIEITDHRPIVRATT